MTTDRHTYRYRSQKAHTYINSAQIKWDRKAVLGVHVLNPGMMSVGDNDSQTDSSQKAQTYIGAS